MWPRAHVPRVYDHVKRCFKTPSLEPRGGQERRKLASGGVNAVSSLFHITTSRRVVKMPTSKNNHS